MKKLILSIFALLCLVIAGKAQYTDLIDFNGAQGALPYYALTISGNVMYGTTAFGGANGAGCIFSVNTDGSNYQDIHDFTGSPADGGNPFCSLILLNGVLYGTTSGEAANNGGIIFSININGTGFTDIHDFSGSAFDGANPYGDLTILNGVIYGVTYNGGLSNDGIIFSMNTNGSGFKDLYDFNGINGAHPGSLTQFGNILYGIASLGGSNNQGCIFSVNINGSRYLDLLDFNGTNGGSSSTSLTLSGNVLYGLTNVGGTNGGGTIFSIDTNGSGFTVLHDFTFAATDGGNPVTTRLTLTGNVLYGMTGQGGASDVGIIFSMNTDGSGFTDLHDFKGTNGAAPQGSLTLFGSTLYGMANLTEVQAEMV